MDANKEPTPAELHNHFQKQENWQWGYHDPYKRRVIQSNKIDISPHSTYGSELEPIKKALDRAINEGCNYCYTEIRKGSNEYPSVAIVYACKYHIETDEEYNKRISDMVDLKKEQKEREINNASKYLSNPEPFKLY